MTFVPKREKKRLKLILLFLPRGAGRRRASRVVLALKDGEDKRGYVQACRAHKAIGETLFYSAVKRLA